jgi:hypothetical protein
MVPISISILTTNGIKVPAVRLLQDLDWDTILQSPYAKTDDELGQEIRQQFDQVRGAFRVDSTVV